MFLLFKAHPAGERLAIDRDNIAGFDRKNATTPNTVQIITYVGGNYEAFPTDWRWGNDDQQMLDWVGQTQG